MRMIKRGRAGFAAGAILALVAACSSGGGSGGHVTLTWWTWTANSDKVVANFEKHHPNITVKTPTIGAGDALYSKLTTALSAGSGAPDVTQIEYEHFPEFMVKHQLVDISQYVDKYKNDFPSWTWKQVSSQGAAYAVPEDIGPMGLVYRPDVLNKYHLPVPATWDQFASDAIKLHQKDPSVALTYFPINDGGYISSLFWQAGAKLFHQNSAESWTVSIDNPVSRKVIDYWGKLIKQGAIPAISDFTPPWQNKVAKGGYAAYLAAAWSPTYEIDEYVTNKVPQKFAVTQMPQWKAGEHANANWGGSTNAVTKQSKHPKEAAEFAAFINTDKSGLTIDEKPATKAGGGRGLFPASVNRAKIGAFSAPIPNFVNKDVNGNFSKYAANVNTGFEWSPWSTYFFSALQKELQSAVNGKQSFTDALKNTQSAVVKYAKAAGFQVSTSG